MAWSPGIAAAMTQASAAATAARVVCKRWAHRRSVGLSKGRWTTASDANLTPTPTATADRPGSPGRRLSRRIHLGCSGSIAGGVVASYRSHLRHLCRRHERRRAGGRLYKGRSAGSAGGSRCLLGARGRSSDLQPAAALADGSPGGALDPGLLAGVHRLRPHGATVLAL